MKGRTWASRWKRASLLGILGELPGQDLDRHFPLEDRVLGSVDFSHPTLAQLLQDLVVGGATADHREPPR